MNAKSDFDRHAAAWLADGPTELNDRVLDAALREVHLTHQRRRWSTPWRTPLMPTYMRLAAGIAIVAVLGIGGLLLSNRGPSVGSPSPAPSSTIVPLGTVPPLTETFTSARYGYSIDYPAGWTVTPAAELIDRDLFAAGGEGEWMDVFAPTDTDGLFRIASVPVPEGVNAAEWIAEIYLRCTGTCFEGLTDAVFDGQPALVREDNLEREVILVLGDRAYFATLFPGPEVGLPYAPELFQALMATLDLRPEDAEVQPSPSVGAPAIGQRFISTIHAIALSYPEGWVTRAATEPWTTQDVPLFEDNSADVMYDPAQTDHLFLLVSSQSHAGKTREAWATALAAGEGCEIELMEWDGGTAWIARACRLVFVAESDIGWAIRLYTSGIPSALEPAYDRLFDDILGTVQLHAAPAGG